MRLRINRASRSEVWADRAEGGRESWGRALGTDRALFLGSRVFVAVKPWAGDRSSLMPRGFALSSDMTVLSARPVWGPKGDVRTAQTVLGAPARLMPVVPTADCLSGKEDEDAGVSCERWDREGVGQEEERHKTSSRRPLGQKPNGRLRRVGL